MAPKVIYSFLGKSPYKWVMIKIKCKSFLKDAYIFLKFLFGRWCGASQNALCHGEKNSQ